MIRSALALCKKIVDRLIEPMIFELDVACSVGTGTLEKEGEWFEED